MLPILCLAAIVHGRVFDQTTGKGLGGVEVSNGSEIVATGADGAYSLEGPVFVITPSGWKTAESPDHLPRFYSMAKAGAATDADFALTADKQPADFQAVLLTDPQPANDREVGYLATSLCAPLGRERAQSPAWKFGLTLGDITYDRPDLYPKITAAIARIGLPWHYINGNHDLTLGIAGEGALACYESAFGPSTYAFHYAHALFIAVGDVRHEGGPRYLGGLRPDQFHFLEQLLSRTPADELVVVFFHIPLFAPDPTVPPPFRLSDRTRLFALLRDHPHVLLLSGHTHAQRHVFYGPTDGWTGAATLHEFNLAAACGGYWGGQPDADGVPIATMSEGTPPGYGILTVHGNTATTEYHPRPSLGDITMSVHVPAVIAPRQGYVVFYASVFDAHDGWKIEAKVDARGWVPMKRIQGWDPAYAAAYLSQDAPGAQPLSTPRLPEPTLCAHLWHGFLPADLPLGPHTVTIRATDPTGHSYVTAQPFTIAPSR